MNKLIQRYRAMNSEVISGMSVIKIVLTYFCCFWLSSSFGADVFKYKDEKGHWVYTDKKPSSKTYEQKKLVVTEADQKVVVVNRGSPQRPVLYAVNGLAGPAQIWLDMERQENLRLTPAGTLEWTIEGPGEQFVVKVEPLDNEKSWAYQWQPRFVPGAVILQSSIDTTALMTPFIGGPFAISQAFKGTASHSQHIEAYYAVDIPMPVGTPIRAVRAGIVMDFERDFSRSGWRDEYADEANFVRILHDDGTMAVYAHLQPESMDVVLGQRLAAGYVIGASGNTGYSTGPHLHFVVQFNSGKKLESVPFEFVGFNRQPQTGDILR